MSKHTPEPDPDLPARLSSLRIDKPFATIDDIVAAMEAAHLFDRQKESKVVKRWRKSEARRMIRSLKDETGWPRWFSIVLTDEKTGERQRVYGQEALFNLEEYRQAISYFSGVSVRAATMANELARRARRKLKLRSRQMPLPFPGIEEGDSKP